jgi:hypothetical protein
MPLSTEQKNELFDKMDRHINGRAPTGKSQRFQAMCQWLKDMSAELKRDPVKVPPDWVRK